MRLALIKYELTLCISASVDTAEENIPRENTVFDNFTAKLWSCSTSDIFDSFFFKLWFVKVKEYMKS